MLLLVGEMLMLERDLSNEKIVFFLDDEVLLAICRNLMIYQLESVDQIWGS